MQYRIHYERNGVELFFDSESSDSIGQNDAVMEVYALLAEEPYSRQVPRGENSVEYTLMVAGVDIESIRYEELS